MSILLFVDARSSGTCLNPIVIQEKEISRYHCTYVRTSSQGQKLETGGRLLAFFGFLFSFYHHTGRNKSLARTSQLACDNKVPKRIQVCICYACSSRHQSINQRAPEEKKLISSRAQEMDGWMDGWLDGSWMDDRDRLTDRRRQLSQLLRAVVGRAMRHGRHPIHPSTLAWSRSDRTSSSRITME